MWFLPLCICIYIYICRARLKYLPQLIIITPSRILRPSRNLRPYPTEPKQLIYIYTYTAMAMDANTVDRRPNQESTGINWEGPLLPKLGLAGTTLPQASAQRSSTPVDCVGRLTALPVPRRSTLAGYSPRVNRLQLPCRPESLLWLEPTSAGEGLSAITSRAAATLNRHHSHYDTCCPKSMKIFGT